LRAGFREWAERTGWPEPDWDDPPRARREIGNLPDEIWRELSHELRDKAVGMPLRGFTESFWQPQAAIENYLRRAVVQIDDLSAFLDAVERVADRDGMLTSSDLQTYREQLAANRSELVRFTDELRTRST
jgi:hypothetical protein